MDPSGHVLTEIYRKSTSTNSFLKWKSHHPEFLKRGIPIGQYIRARQNCSTEEKLELECRNLYEHFQESGYPKKWLRKAYWRAKLSIREELLRDGEGRSTENGKYIQLNERQPKRCIGTYDGYTKEVNQILKRHWSILTTDVDLIEVLPKYLSVNYRRGQNLRDILVHSNLQVDKPNT